MTVAAPRWQTSAGWHSTVLLFVVLAGLFGMHGLSGHGTASHMASGVAPAVASPSHLSEGVHTAARTGVAHDLAPVPGATPGEDPGHGDDPMTMVGLCLAVLGAAILAWAFLLFSGSARSRPRPARSAPQSLRRRSRDPDPPSLHVLCICRC